MKNTIVTVFGGSGFLGRYVVKELAKAGYMVNIASRTPNRALHLKTAGDVGQIALTSVNLRDDVSVENALRNSDIVINLVGIMNQRGKQRFSAVHANGAERLAQMAAKMGVKQFIHVSALGIEGASADYARSKMAGEQAVSAAFPQATILRPSLLFGTEDGFFNRFAAMARHSPFLPLIGGGKTQFQPVYVMDVARALLAVIRNRDLQGKTYELAGPRSYSFRSLLEYIVHVTGHKRHLLAIPFPLADFLATFLQWLPKPPLTRDQVRMLHTDSVLSGNQPGFDALGIIPTPLEAVVPGYLERFAKRS